METNIETMNSYFLRYVKMTQESSMLKSTEWDKKQGNGPCACVSILSLDLEGASSSGLSEEASWLGIHSDHNYSLFDILRCIARLRPGGPAPPRLRRKITNTWSSGFAEFPG